MNSTVYNDICIATITPEIVEIRLNRPTARNALRTDLLAEIADVLTQAAADETVRCVVITGGEKVFAAGADIKEMAALDAIGVLNDKRPQYWSCLRTFPKPLIAAVNGYALGGGCELAMHADIIIAGDSALFGQPEINLGIIPGAGGTQRLIHAVGKARAMKMVLSGEMIKAQEALEAGLVAEVTPPELTIERAHALAKTIAKKSPLAVRLAKEAMLNAFEMSLTTGLQQERKAFALLAASDDRQEGINAFIEKRSPTFTGR